MTTEITDATPPGLALALATPVLLSCVDTASLDRALPGVHVLANQLDSMLDRHRHLRHAHYCSDIPDERAEIATELNELAFRIRGVWQAAHLVTGAEQQARRTVDGILRGYVVDADRQARLGWLDHTAGDDLDLPNAYSRAAGRVRGIVRDLAARHYATEEGALP